MGITGPELKKGLLLMSLYDETLISGFKQRALCLLRLRKNTTPIIPEVSTFYSSSFEALNLIMDLQFLTI